MLFTFDSYKMKVIFAYILILLLNVTTFSQNPFYVAINKSAGLPSNTIYNIFEDSKGFMWFTTSEGLTKYDGFETKLYQNNKYPTLEGSCIKEDKYGRIWYENFDGNLFYVKNDSLHTIEQHKPIGFFNFGIINDDLYLIQEKGVDVFSLKDLKFKKNIPIKIKTEGLNFNWCEQTTNSYFVLADSIFEIKEKRIIEKSSFSISEIDRRPTHLLNVNNTIIPVSIKHKYKNIFKKIGNKFVIETTYENEDFYQAANFVDNKYWFCSSNGVYAYEIDGKPAFENNPLFFGKNISCVYKDRNDGFWISTLNEGIFYISNFKSKQYFSELKINKITTNKNNAYIGTKDGILANISLTDFKNTELVKLKAKHEIVLINIDTLNNELNFCTGNLLIRDLNKNSNLSISVSIKDLTRIDNKYYAFTSSAFSGLIETNKSINSIWDSINNKSLYKLKFERTFTSLIPKSRGRCVCLFNNKIYFGTHLGLFMASPSSVKEIKLNNSHFYIAKLYNYLNYVYALTTNGQLYSISENDSIKNLSKQYNITNSKINKIKIIKNHLFLISDNVFQIVDLNTEKLIKTTIPSYEINDVELHNNSLLLATNNGLITYPFSEVISQTFNPKLILNNIRLNNINRIILNNSVFNYNENNIEINYSILSFNTLGKFPLYYKINSNPWVLASPNSRTLFLNELSPNDYTIQFKLGENDKNAFPTQIIKFKINKPWWKSIGAISLYLVLTSIILFLVFIYKTKSITKKNELLTEKLILERNLRDSMLTSIKSQMNPHFFYNALNTIQSFIFSDDKRNASTYLSKFSKLTRLILEMSEKETVTLQEEIEALKLYLDIEQVRFNGELNYNITIGNNINTDFIKIPAMLIQPYVENALKHGLLHKKGTKHIDLNFSLIDKTLKIEVNDNGIGRNKSQEINAQKIDKHKSFSTNANLKRIELLNANNFKISLNIKDKVNSDCASDGTDVTITCDI